MRMVRGSVAILLLACACALPAHGASRGDVNFLIGQKALAEDTLEPSDEGGVLGAVMSFGGDGWPVRLAADVVLYADEEDVFDLTGDTAFSLAIVEAAVGVRKIWSSGAVRPYLGGGIELVTADLEEDDDFFFDDDDGEGSGLGVWAGGGVFWRLGNHFNLGFDARWNRAEVDVEFDDGGEIEDVEVGGFAAGLTLGFGW